jgi:hypothetical protein
MEVGTMPAQGDEVRRLRDLHDEYAWEVNAAVAEGREDLVWRLVDDYLAEAMREMTDAYVDACQRPDCTMCARPTPVRPAGRLRTAWWRRGIGNRRGSAAR